LKKNILVTAIVIASILGGICYATAYNSFSTADASNVEGPSSGYLADLLGNKMKIYLVSTHNPKYDFYKGTDTDWIGGEIRDGDPCFVVNITVRNDYTKDPALTYDNSPDLCNNHVKLTAYLYNHQGRVDAVDVTYPINSLHGGHVFVVEPGETYSLELCLSTDCKDIERFEIYVAYIGPLMEP
jgi:hypothetical protein